MADPERFGRATWPGVSDPIGCSYTCSHGISPSTATLTILLEDGNIARQNGTLFMTDGVIGMALKDATVDGQQVIDAGGGRALALTILDRRWKWKFGTCSARFNERDDRGLPIGTLRPAAWLAAWLLERMGERGYEIDLPSSDSEAFCPFVDWQEVNPAQALAELCDRFGRVVVFQPQTDRVIITQPGFGRRLPTLDAIEQSPGVNLCEYPSGLEVAGGPAVFQVALRLEAVGEEQDGSIVPLNDLSYTPTDGWATARRRFFNNVTVPGKKVPFFGWKVGPMSLDETKDLAARCVFRYFRITLDKLGNADRGDPKNFKIQGLDAIGGGVRITDINQIDMLEGIFYADRTDSRLRPIVTPPQLYGQVSRGILRPESFFKSLGVTGPADSLRGVGITVDARRRLIIADRMLFTATGSELTGTDAVADLTLLISVNVRDENGGLVRYRRGVTIPTDAKTSPLVKVDENIRLVSMTEYERSTENDPSGNPITTWWVTATSNNLEVCDSLAVPLANREAAMLRTDAIEDKTYPGILRVEPDGAVRQITWSVGNLQPCTTRMSLNSEHSLWTPSYAAQREKQQMRFLLDRASPPAGTAGVESKWHTPPTASGGWDMRTLAEYLAARR